MEALIIHPKSKEEKATLKSILKALKIDFSLSTEAKVKSKYNAAFVKKIQESSKQAKQGKVTKIAIKNLWK